MGGIILLLGLCAAMAVASFLAGALPLSVSLSQSQLRLLASVGVGVLVGTSLIIIIPEGIEAAATPSETSHVHRLRMLVRRSPWDYDLDIRRIESAVQLKTSRSHAEEDGVEHIISSIPTTVLGPRSWGGFLSARGAEAVKSNGLRVPALPRDSDTSGAQDSSNSSPTDVPQRPDDEHNDDDGNDDDGHGHDAHDEEGAEVPTVEIGVSMILGFVLMFLIDRLPRHASDRLQSAPQTRHISLDNLGGGSETASVDEEAESFLGSMTPSPRRARSLATTLGLVIHAAADGIALGASSTTSDMKLGFIIFFAIMIHKAPAAFGLTSVLLKQGLSKRAARAHLIIFSLAAPLGAISTWLLITLLGGGASMEGESGAYWTGMLLLFSGGTFLYVAMHAMQEDGGSPGHGHEHNGGANGYAEAASASQRKQKGPRMRDTLATVGGMLLPLLTQFFGHHH